MNSYHLFYDVINCVKNTLVFAIMANVFTAANFLPRSTTLSDYRGHDATKNRVFPRILSPTRRANPHPIGLKYQLINQKKPVNLISGEGGGGGEVIFLVSKLNYFFKNIFILTVIRNLASRFP